MSCTKKESESGGRLSCGSLNRLSNVNDARSRARHNHQARRIGRRNRQPGSRKRIAAFRSLLCLSNGLQPPTTAPVKKASASASGFCHQCAQLGELRDGSARRRITPATAAVARALGACKSSMSEREPELSLQPAEMVSAKKYLQAIQRFFLLGPRGRTSACPWNFGAPSYGQGFIRVAGLPH
jgi:hypothetical protein